MRYQANTEMFLYYHEPQYLQDATGRMQQEGQWVTQEGENWFNECLKSGELTKLRYDHMFGEWIEEI